MWTSEILVMGGYCEVWEIAFGLVERIRLLLFYVGEFYGFEK